VPARRSSVKLRADIAVIEPEFPEMDPDRIRDNLQGT
jgi:hypothetical protein